MIYLNMIAAILVTISTLASIDIAYCRTCDYVWFGGGLAMAKDECLGSSGSKDYSFKFICDGTAGKMEYHSDNGDCSSSSYSTLAVEWLSWTYVCASKDDTCEAYTIFSESYDSSTTCSGTASRTMRVPVISKTLGCEKVYHNATEYSYGSWEITDNQVKITAYEEDCSTVVGALNMTEGCTQDEDGSSTKLSITIISAAHQSFSCQTPLFYLAFMVAAYIFN